MCPHVPPHFPLEVEEPHVELEAEGGDPPDDDSDGSSIYSQEIMIYLEDESDSDSDIIELDEEGSWANPIDLTCDEEEEEGEMYELE